MHRCGIVKSSMAIKRNWVKWNKGFACLRPYRDVVCAQINWKSDIDFWPILRLFHWSVSDRTNQSFRNNRWFCFQRRQHVGKQNSPSNVGRKFSLAWLLMKVGWIYCQFINFFPSRRVWASGEETLINRLADWLPLAIDIHSNFTITINKEVNSYDSCHLMIINCLAEKSQYLWVFFIAQRWLRVKSLRRGEWEISHSRGNH